MNRRAMLQSVAAPFLASFGALLAAGRASSASGAASRARPGDPGWPSASEWERLRREVEGRLIEVRSPLAACVGSPDSARCAELFAHLRNPYYLGDEAGLTQALGWVDAWTSRPSAYAVAAETTQDVVAAVNFARQHNLRLVVKGGGHSYQGTSSAPDSLLIWTRRMNAIVTHDAFVGAGCEGRYPPVHAVSVGAGAMWGQVYDAVTTKAGR
jgi:FAD binding domain